MRIGLRGTYLTLLIKIVGNIINAIHNVCLNVFSCIYYDSILRFMLYHWFECAYHMFSL